MPLPRPGKDESKKDFVTRCVKMMNDKSEMDSNKQRVAVCYQIWNDHHTKATLLDRIAEQNIINKIQD